MTMTMTMAVPTVVGNKIKLLNALREAEIDAAVDEYGEIHIVRGPFRVRISPRMHYCDRGRWLVHNDAIEIAAVHAETVDPTLACVDNHDLFPRYFFHADTLVKELKTWLDIRMQNINSKNQK